jgi:hypothetical protein
LYEPSKSKGEWIVIENDYARVLQQEIGALRELLDKREKEIERLRKLIYALEISFRSIRPEYEGVMLDELRT